MNAMAPAARPAPIEDIKALRRWRRLQMRRAVRRWWSAVLAGGRRALVAADAGMATAEYAIVLVAAAGFAGVLMVILRSDAVRDQLSALVTNVLNI